MIDLRSDTVTRPTPSMLEFMMNAKTGDDVFGEDPTVNELERKAAAIFGMEAGMFCSSGTMANQIAIKAQTSALDEVVCDKSSHIYNYETGAYGFISRVAIKMIDGDRGRFKAHDVLNAINPDFEWLPRTRLVCLENTCNKGGGSYYTLKGMQDISNLCRQVGLNIHLDGARIFNALTETGDDPLTIGKLFDSISFCLSKGLGAPVGSMLIGNKEFIKKARRYRKAMGGGMRQVGILAAAGIFALDHNISRLKDDHRRAKIIGNSLLGKSYTDYVMPVDTNIVIFRLKHPNHAATFIDDLADRGILAVPFGPSTVRFVTHLDFTEDMLDKTVEVLKALD